MTICFGVVAFKKEARYRLSLIQQFRTLFPDSINMVHRCLNHTDMLVLPYPTQKYTAIIDSKNDKMEVTLTTDAFGFSPIYYTTLDGVLLWASRQRYLLPFILHLKLNDNVFCELFQLGYVAPPDTLIKNVYSLPSTKKLVFDGKVSLQNKAYDINTESNIDLDPDKLPEYLRHSLQNVANQNRIGLLYSHGLDSSWIAQVAYETLHRPLDLFTLIANSYDDLLSFEHFNHAPAHHAHLFSLSVPDFWRSIHQSIILGESEMVGSLSLNAAAEYLLAEKITLNAPDVVLTGDDNWIVPREVLSQTPSYYALKYGLLSGLPLHRLLQKHKHSYLYYCHKYSSIIQHPSDRDLFIRHRAEVHATLIGKINGKIRMGYPKAPCYYFPLLDNDYMQRINILNNNYHAFNYRITLKHFLASRNLANTHHPTRSKTWMPTFFDHIQQETLLNIIQHKIDTPNNIIYDLFDKSAVKATIKQLNPLAKIKLMMTFLYLMIFHDTFISSRKELEKNIL